mgnify:CR=1 FL=1
MSDKNMWIASGYYALGVLAVILVIIGAVSMLGYEPERTYQTFGILILLPLTGLISFQFGWQSPNKEESK